MLIDAIVGHLVGDYLLQNDYLAQGKKQSSAVCTLHCLIWTMCVCAFGGLGVLAFLILFVTHFIQDRTMIVTRWMKFMKQEKFLYGPCFPWSVIVVDNVWHIVTIYAVCHWLD